MESRRFEPVVVKAPNRGPFTLDGTRTHLVGAEEVAVIDPGPDMEDHVRALFRALEKAQGVTILLTHGHSDHAGGAAALARALGARVLGPASVASPPPGKRIVVPLEEGGVGILVDGDVVTTDQGALRAISIPGHTPDHLAYLWEETRALFVGDLILGKGNTTWLGEYPGCVADYLASLEKVRALEPSVLYPAHGNAVSNIQATLDLFRDHRLERLREVEEAREAHPSDGPEELVGWIYGQEIPPALMKAARSSIEVMIHHLDTREASG
jgi:glyoxylase-like metal-dependent hydrolase (beta-lactamase superfamily II)